VRLSAVRGKQPRHIGAAAGGLLRSGAVLLREVLLSVGRRHEHRRAEPFDEVLGVALVPRCCEHDDQLAVGREPQDLARHGERIKEEQTRPVVDRVRRNFAAPRFARRPVGMRCLPVPDASP
jgi:hypothetical protein